MNAHRRIQLLPIAGHLAGVIADPPMHRWHRIVAGYHLPGFSESALGGEGKPRLDVLPGRASLIAGRKEIKVNRTLRTIWAGAAFVPKVRWSGQVRRFVFHLESSVAR